MNNFPRDKSNIFYTDLSIFSHYKFFDNLEIFINDESFGTFFWTRLTHNRILLEF